VFRGTDDSECRGQAYVDARKAALNGYEVENEAWRDEGSTRVLTVIYRYAGGVARARPLPVAHWDEAEARPDAIVLRHRLRFEDMREVPLSFVERLTWRSIGWFGALFGDRKVTLPGLGIRMMQAGARRAWVWPELSSRYETDRLVVLVVASADNAVLRAP
jgi:hypothetical protein